MSKLIREVLFGPNRVIQIGQECSVKNDMNDMLRRLLTGMTLLRSV